MIRSDSVVVNTGHARTDGDWRVQAIYYDIEYNVVIAEVLIRTSEMETVFDSRVTAETDEHI